MSPNEKALKEHVARLQAAGYDLSIEWAYDKPRCYNKAGDQELSPRLTTARMLLWLHGYVTGVEAETARVLGPVVPSDAPVEVPVETPEDTESYELVYGTGGHGGPYVGLEHAKERAYALLRGNPAEHAIYIVPRSAPQYHWKYATQKVVKR